MKLLGFGLIFLTFTTAVMTQYFSRDSQCRSGTCTPIGQCSAFDWFLQKDFITADDYNEVMNRKCGWEGRQVKVCCPSQTQNTSPPPTTNYRTNLLPIPGKSNCGIDANVNKITHGQETGIDEFPWMALLEYDTGRGKTSFGCGGALINERYVVTAAHCIRTSPRLVNIRLGEWDTSKTRDCIEPTVCTDDVVNVGIEQIIVHDGYSASGTENHHDIALIRLNQPVTYSFFVKPICLPSTSQLRSHITNPEGSRFLIAGWGRTETGKFSDVKRKAEVLGVQSDTCGQVYGKARPQRQITSNQICAGGQNEKDSCGGDSGGPLMASYKDQNGAHFLYLAGVVSYGPTQCGTVGWPGVYTRVSNYMDWIESKLKP